MPTATNPPTPAAATTDNTTTRSTLPPPAIFDILPPLHGVLSRLLVPSTALTSGLPQSQQADQPLSPKELVTAASAVTAKIQKARAAVHSMEGVDMSLEEQEEIIQELETEVLRGKGVLQGLGDSCARATADAGEKDNGMEIMKAEGEKDAGAGLG